MHNLDIREAIASAGVRYWRVAEAYGLSDTNFSKLLRRELPLEKKEKIFKIIRDLSNNLVAQEAMAQ